MEPTNFDTIALIVAVAFSAALAVCLAYPWPGPRADARRVECALALVLAVAILLPLALFVVLLGGGAPQMVRWGWPFLLAAAFAPRLSRWRRIGLVVIALAWIPFSLDSIAHRFWLFPHGLGPPAGFRVVERVNASEVTGIFYHPPPFLRARYQSADTASPKPKLLDSIEDAMTRAGWRTEKRGDGKAAVLDLGGKHEMNERDESCLRWLASPPRFHFDFEPRLTAMLGDEGLSYLRMCGPYGYHLAVFFIYDQPDGRIIDIALGQAFD